MGLARATSETLGTTGTAWDRRAARRRISRRRVPLLLELDRLRRATYTFGGEVPWPPEAGSQMVRPLVDAREHTADRMAPCAGHNGDSIAA